MSTPRAFITGITGMVGSHMVDYLLENTDWEIFGLARWRSPLTNLSAHLDRINSKDRVSLVTGDLNDMVSLESAVREVRPDYVFHLAAQSDPKTSFAAPIDTIRTNVLGTAQLLEVLRAHAPRAVIHICASSEVFGRVPREKLPIREDCTFHPASPYAISKAGTDLLGRLYGEAYGLTVMTTRLFTHTGPRRGDVFAESSFAKQVAMIEAGYAEPVVRVGNLQSLRTYADVRDVVRAYHLLVTVNPIGGEYYNIGGGHTCTVGEMLETLIGLSTREGIKVEVDPNRLRPIDADLQVPDVSKFTAHTGWRPEIPFEKTMGDLLDYWRDRITREGAFVLR